MENAWLDIQHRGFAAYLRETEDSEICKKRNRVFLDARGTDEKITVAFWDCKVKTDWIEQMEAALPFLENAVRENRQFILRQGQTVPIEKVKRVSKASVEHLSRHSEFITSQSEADGEWRLDRLHITENVGTHTIYENRFLYMLLCLVRDFANLRYRRITELAASFSTDITVDKEMCDGDGRIRYRLNFSETSRIHGGSVAAEEIDRIRNILQTVERLLRMDPMKEVSAAPMLKPPVIRTNVMLHDRNFKAAFALYTFLSAYEGEGFERIARYRRDGVPTESMRKDLAALAAITSYLSYRCGGMYDTLQERFLAEEKRRKEAAERMEREKIAALRERLGPLDDAATEYICALERSLARMDSREEQLREAAALRTQMQSRLDAAEKVAERLQAGKQELERALSEKDRQLSEQTQQTEQAREQLAQAQNRFDEAYKQQEQAFVREYEALGEKYRLTCAGSRTFTEDADCSSKEAFAELDAQYAAFKRFYDRQWRLARKRIRREKLWKKD